MVDEWDITEGVSLADLPLPADAVEQTAPLDYPGVEFTPTGLVLPEALPFDRWERIVQTLPRIGDAVKWAIGDALNFGEAKYGEKYTQAMEATGLEYHTLRLRCHVASRFAMFRRRNIVPWWVYGEISSRPEEEQEALLDWAECEKPTREAFRAKLRGGSDQSALPLIDRPPAVEVPRGVSPVQAAALVNSLAELPQEARPAAVRAVQEAVRRVRSEEKQAVRAQEDAAAVAALPDISDRYALHVADLRSAPLGDCCADVIITDPPYPREYLPLYEDLARLAARVLKPGGSLLVMVGQSYLPDVLALMTPHITYHWVISYLTPGGQAVQLWQRNVNTFWKPVLWFTKGEYSGPWQGDVTRSAVNDNDKRFHEWGQSESGMADIVERFSRPGDTILDPFLGGGTTGVVAITMNRKFIGVDVDSQAVETTKRRLADVCTG